MLAVSFAVVVLALVVIVGYIAMRRAHRADEVERFHRARRMTTEWARDGMTKPLIADDFDGADRAGDDAPTGARGADA